MEITLDVVRRFGDFCCFEVVLSLCMMERQRAHLEDSNMGISSASDHFKNDDRTTSFGDNTSQSTEFFSSKRFETGRTTRQSRITRVTKAYLAYVKFFLDSGMNFRRKQ